jgi:hypothetical protein
MTLRSYNLQSTSHGMEIDLLFVAHDIKIPGAQYSKPVGDSKARLGSFGEAVSAPAFSRSTPTNQRVTLYKTMTSDDFGVMLQRDMTNVSAPDQQQARRKQQVDSIMNLIHVVSDLTRSQAWGDPVIVVGDSGTGGSSKGRRACNHKLLKSTLQCKRVVCLCVCVCVCVCVDCG